MDNIKPSNIDGVHTNRWDPRLNYAGSMWVVLHDTFFSSNFEWNHNGADQPTFGTIEFRFGSLTSILKSHYYHLNECGNNRHNTSFFMKFYKTCDLIWN